MRVTDLYVNESHGGFTYWDAGYGVRQASCYVYEFDIYTIESLGERLHFISRAKYAPA